LLAANPENYGDYLHEDLWSLDQPPLRIHYVIDRAKIAVIVVAVSVRSYK